MHPNDYGLQMELPGDSTGTLHRFCRGTSGVAARQGGLTTSAYSHHVLDMCAGASNWRRWALNLTMRLLSGRGGITSSARSVAAPGTVSRSLLRMGRPSCYSTGELRRHVVLHLRQATADLHITVA